MFICRKLHKENKEILENVPGFFKGGADFGAGERCGERVVADAVVVLRVVRLDVTCKEAALPYVSQHLSQFIDCNARMAGSLFTKLQQ